MEEGAPFMTQPYRVMSGKQRTQSAQAQLAAPQVPGDLHHHARNCMSAFLSRRGSTMQRNCDCNQCSYWGRMSPDEVLEDRTLVGVCYLTVHVVETRATFTCLLWRSREQFGALPA